MGLSRVDLISLQYESQLRQMHSAKVFAAGGGKHIRKIEQLIGKVGAKSLLDYGCGAVDLSLDLPNLDVRGYDPAVEGRDELPTPADLVVCTDVLEHIEPDRLDAVLGHIFELTIKICFVVIATRPADKRLPDGRNAHLIIDNAGWWVQRLRALDWIASVHDLTADDVTLWLRKRGC
jgi:hypothetical protein